MVKLEGLVAARQEKSYFMTIDLKVNFLCLSRRHFPFYG